MGHGMPDVGRWADGVGVGRGGRRLRAFAASLLVHIAGAGDGAKMTDARQQRPARPHDRDVRTLVAFTLTAAAVLTLLAIGSRLLLGDWLAFDAAILRGSRALTGDGGVAVRLAGDLTALGNDTSLWIATLVAAGWLAVAGRRRALAHLLVATAGGGLLTATLKQLVGRARPDLVAHLVAVHSPSFPSGHAADTAFVFATLAMVAASPGTAPAERRYLMAAALLLSVSVGVTRVILGVHWPSDVLAGWAIGGLWAAACARMLQR